MKYNHKLFSIIIPARNEAAQISKTLRAAIKTVARFEGTGHRTLDLMSTRAEIIVVDNASTDGTLSKVHHFIENHSVLCFNCSRLKAPCARNYGAMRARGQVLVFVDADTWIPEDGLKRILCLIRDDRFEAGFFRLASQRNGIRSWFWWTFWDYVRQLPLARAKALPACMFCTRKAFEQYGPFDEELVIGEEWPILADLYRVNRECIIYDRTLTAFTSSRRMELQSFGYVRTFMKYVWAILHQTGRVRYSDSIRQRKEI